MLSLRIRSLFDWHFNARKRKVKPLRAPRSLSETFPCTGYKAFDIKGKALRGNRVTVYLTVGCRAQERWILAQPTIDTNTIFITKSNTDATTTNHNCDTNIDDDNDDNDSNTNTNNDDDNDSTNSNSNDDNSNSNSNSHT